MNVGEKYKELYQAVMEEHEKVFEKQDLTELEQFMELICKAKRIFLMGVGREGISTRGFAMRLMHLGKESHWIWDDTTPGMHEGDLFIATNGSGTNRPHYLCSGAGKKSRSNCCSSDRFTEADLSAAGRFRIVRSGCCFQRNRRQSSSVDSTYGESV